MTKIYDNQKESFTQGLATLLGTPGVTRCDFCVGYFNLRGWDLVSELVEKLPGSAVWETDREGNALRSRRTCRLLVGMLRPPEELLREYYDTSRALGEAAAGRAVDAAERNRQRLLMAEHFRRQITFGTPNGRDQATLRTLARQLREGRVAVRLYLSEPLHAKLYLAHLSGPTMTPHLALMGSSNLTFAGCNGNGELNADFTEQQQAAVLAAWFDEHWNDRRATVDITEELAAAIDESWATERATEPYLIYMRLVWHLSEEARLGLSECAVPALFKDKLFEFQQTAVQITARRLMRGPFGGAMIGDVVGLGKTITACAIAKVFEQTYAGSTLIVCPANLVGMWREHVALYDLKAEVRSLAGSLDGLGERLFRLVIVDESHNLRSGDAGKRYTQLRELIERQRQANESAARVLLLSATPYNKQPADLANQLGLFVSDDDDLGVRPEAFLAKYQGKNGQGEQAFQADHADINTRTLAAFRLSEEADDWNALMRLFLIRRTRSFIKECYAQAAPDGRLRLEIGGQEYYFPRREPVSVRCAADEQLAAFYSEAVTDTLAGLHLPRYGLQQKQYIGEEREWKPRLDAGERSLMCGLARAGGRLVGFTKATFFKRLDSSGYAFLLTLTRHVLRNMVALHALDKGLSIPVHDENELFLEEEAGDPDEDEDSLVSYSGGAWHFATSRSAYRRAAERHYERLLGDRRVRWLPGAIFKDAFGANLRADVDALLGVISLCSAWRPADDAKLNELHGLLTGRVAGDQALIFTQYADTARYVHGELTRRGLQQCQWVQGGDPRTVDDVVRHFSPRSNHVGPDATPSIRVLIATDALSEGQNLQDAHVVMNYDLPWAIIRLIQRAGRVDRIGQRAPAIQCYSFFPADGVEKIIQLRERLNERLKDNSDIIGSDEVFWEDQATNLQIAFDGAEGSLDEVESGEVDLTSLALKIWQTATGADESLAERVKRLPEGAYSARGKEQGTGNKEQGAGGKEQGTWNKEHGTVNKEQGVGVPGAEGSLIVTLTRTSEGVDVLSGIDTSGRIVSTDAARLLSLAQCVPTTPAVAPLGQHLELVARAVKESDAIARQTWAGATGKARSLRNQVLDAIQHTLDHDKTLTPADRASLNEAYTALNAAPLTDTAKTPLKAAAALKTPDRDQQMAQAALQLLAQGRLTQKSANNDGNTRALVSLGLVDNKQQDTHNG